MSWVCTHFSNFPHQPIDKCLNNHLEGWLGDDIQKRKPQKAYAFETSSLLINGKDFTGQGTCPLVPLFYYFYKTFSKIFFLRDE
jgi:hypothetical protein